MSRSRAVRDFLVVLGADLADSRRSRKAAVLIVLYLIAAVSASLIFVKVVHEIEEQMAKALAVDKSSQTGRMTSRLWEMEQFRELVSGLVGDDELADKLLGFPPLALFYGWIAMSFAPLLVVLTSSDSIATEVGSGSARYSLVRTSRLAWAAGKAVAQALVALLAILLGAAGAWIVGQFWLTGFQPWATAAGIFGLSLQAWVYCLPFLGMAMGISQLTRSSNIARALGLVGLAGITTLSAVSAHYVGPGWARLWDLGVLLTPHGHQLNLWHPDLVHFGPAVLYLLGLSGLYFILGHLVFARRDA